MKITENVRRHFGETVTIRWGTSRGQDSYGYTTCSLRNSRGERIAYCNGGGYDMRGTVLANWMTHTFAKELLKLKASDMPEHSHWECDKNPKRVCYNHECVARRSGLANTEDDAVWKFSPETENCPHCGGCTQPDPHAGKTVQDGRSFYGLCFVDPTYNPEMAKLERCDDTFTKPADVGKTFKQLRAEGKIVDLDVIRTWYKNTSKVPTKRHTVPSMDGACGMSEVTKVLNAIGVDLKMVVDTKKLDVYEIVKYVPYKPSK